MSLGANRLVDRRNRVVWTVLWLAVTAAGVAILLAGFGAFGREVQGRPLLTDDMAQRALDGRAWLWALGLLVALVAVVAGLAWLWLEVRPVPHGGEVVVTVGDQDRARLPVGSLLDVVVADAGEGDGVRSSRGRLDPRSPVVAVLHLTVEADADLGALADHLDGVADRLERTLGQPARLDVEVDLVDATSTPTRRVA